MNASSLHSLVKSGLFATLIVLASCGKKETVEPSYSPPKETAGIKQNEKLMPIIDRKIVREDGLDMKKVGPVDEVSTSNKISNLTIDDRFTKSGNEEDLSTASASRPGRGTPDASRFKQISPRKSISTNARPGRGTPDMSRFRKLALARKNDIH